MSTISSLYAGSTWQGWSISAASSVLGFETEATDLLGADFLSGADADLVTLSDEAQAVLDSQDDASVDLSSVVDDMSASQVAAYSLTVSSGEVLSAMLDELESMDLLSGMTV